MRMTFLIFARLNMQEGISVSNSASLYFLLQTKWYSESACLPCNSQSHGEDGAVWFEEDGNENAGEENGSRTEEDESVRASASLSARHVANRLDQQRPVWLCVLTHLKSQHSALPLILFHYFYCFHWVCTCLCVSSIKNRACTPTWSE